MTLIARGCRALAYIFLGVYVLLLTFGVWRLWNRRQVVAVVSG